MKNLIRKNVFETNSSSCHSFTVTESNVYNNIPNLGDSGILYLQSGEFGWEQDTYFDFYSKAAYLIVYIRDWSKNNKTKFKEIFENVLKEVTCCEEIEYEEGFWAIEKRIATWDNNREYESNVGEGYIDHQSVEDSDLDYLFEDTEKLKNFLFDSNSYIETDNDNH